VEVKLHAFLTTTLGGGELYSRSRNFTSGIHKTEAWVGRRYGLDIAQKRTVTLLLVVIELW